MKFKCLCCEIVVDNRNAVDYIEEEQSGRLNNYCSHLFVPMTDKEVRDYERARFLKEALESRSSA